jgi:hypothetical protein
MAASTIIAERFDLTATEKGVSITQALGENPSTALLQAVFGRMAHLLELGKQQVFAQHILSDKLRADVEKARKERDSAKAQRDETQAQRDEAVSECQKLRSSLSSIKTSLSAQGSKSQEAVASISDLKQKFATEQKRVEELMQQLEEANEKNQQLEAQAKAARKGVIVDPAKQARVVELTDALQDGHETLFAFLFKPKQLAGGGAGAGSSSGAGADQGGDVVGKKRRRNDPVIDSSGASGPGGGKYELRNPDMMESDEEDEGKGKPKRSLGLTIAFFLKILDYAGELWGEEFFINDGDDKLSLSKELRTLYPQQQTHTDTFSGKFNLKGRRTKSCPRSYKGEACFSGNPFRQEASARSGAMLGVKIAGADGKQLEKNLGELFDPLLSVIVGSCFRPTVSSFPSKERAEINKAWDTVVEAAWDAIDHILLSREKKVEISSAGKNLDEEITKALARYNKAIPGKPFAWSSISLEVCRKVVEPLDCLADFLKLGDNTFTRRLLAGMQEDLSKVGGAFVNQRKNRRIVRDKERQAEASFSSSSSSSSSSSAGAGQAKTKTFGAGAAASADDNDEE